MPTEYGSGGTYTVEMEGPFAGGGGSGGVGVRMSTLSAPATAWKGGESPYSQVVTVVGITINSKIDIQLSADQMVLFHDKNVSFTVANERGVVTLYAIGDKPKNDCVFQVTLTETDAAGNKIWGNTISTTKPGEDGKDGLDGKNGSTPIRGVDYWNADDIATIESYVNDYVESVILGGEW